MTDAKAALGEAKRRLGDLAGAALDAMQAMSGLAMNALKTRKMHGRRAWPTT